MSELMHRRLKAGYLARVTVGGDFTLPERLGAAPVRDDKILLLSAGIGITPMIGVLRWLRQREKKRCSDPNRCVSVYVCHMLLSRCILLNIQNIHFEHLHVYLVSFSTRFPSCSNRMQRVSSVIDMVI